MSDQAQNMPSIAPESSQSSSPQSTIPQSTIPQSEGKASPDPFEETVLAYGEYLRSAELLESSGQNPKSDLMASKYARPEDAIPASSTTNPPTTNPSAANPPTTNPPTNNPPTTNPKKTTSKPSAPEKNTAESSALKQSTAPEPIDPLDQETALIIHLARMYGMPYRFITQCPKFIREHNDNVRKLGGTLVEQFPKFLEQNYHVNYIHPMADFTDPSFDSVASIQGLNLQLYHAQREAQAMQLGIRKNILDSDAEFNRIQGDIRDQNNAMNSVKSKALEALAMSKKNTTIIATLQPDVDNSLNLSINNGEKLLRLEAAYKALQSEHEKLQSEHKAMHTEQKALINDLHDLFDRCNRQQSQIDRLLRGNPQSQSLFNMSSMAASIPAGAAPPSHQQSLGSDPHYQSSALYAPQPNPSSHQSYHSQELTPYQSPPPGQGSLNAPGQSLAGFNPQHNPSNAPVQYEQRPPPSSRQYPGANNAQSGGLGASRFAPQGGGGFPGGRR